MNEFVIKYSPHFWALLMWIWINRSQRIRFADGPRIPLIEQFHIVPLSMIQRFAYSRLVESSKVYYWNINMSEFCPHKVHQIYQPVWYELLGAL